MAEIRTVTTLKYKRDDITRAIAAYEKKLNQARADLAHVNAAIRIFELGDAEGTFAANLARAFHVGDPALDGVLDRLGENATVLFVVHVWGVRQKDNGQIVAARVIAVFCHRAFSC